MCLDVYLKRVQFLSEGVAIAPATQDHVRCLLCSVLLASSCPSYLIPFVRPSCSVRLPADCQAEDDPWKEATFRVCKEG
eukprot:767274-Hanusia_phi.AAC.3